MSNNETENLTSQALDSETQINATAQVIPVIEEEVTIEKKVVEAGRVRISKHAKEYEKLVDVPLLHEEVSIERVPLNQVVLERLPTRYDGDTLIIPVVEEQVFVEKRLVLVEELHVRKQTIETHKPQRITLLKEEVEITRVAGNENSGS